STDKFKTNPMNVSLNNMILNIIAVSITVPLLLIAIAGFFIWYCVCVRSNGLHLPRMRKFRINRTSKRVSFQLDDQVFCNQVATSCTTEQFSNSIDSSINNVLYSKYSHPYANITIGPLNPMEGDDLKESFSSIDPQQFDDVQAEEYSNHIYGNDESVEDSLYYNYRGPHNEYIEEDDIYIIPRE
uniref:Uncharacterized protein n=1 Tax=Callorhinchus milii TaxID=7868 RepID=A0A4W3KHS7_CALMI